MGAKQQGTDSATVANRWQVVARTLCFVTYQGDLLLMKRSLTKRIFPGFYNGVGGHIERDEDPLTGARREILEETGLHIPHLRFCGSTHVDAGQSTGIILYIFTGEADSREVMDCEEGTLEWLPLAPLLASLQDGTNQLPLVEDLPITLPRIFGTDAPPLPFFAHVTYDVHDQIVFRVAN
ncbi:MAG: NUDIX domain-containing protein [Chloroflexi bacterium]|nr:NUDIX domain-containing protein [Chloroflexota bacterium]